MASHARPQIVTKLSYQTCLRSTCLRVLALSATAAILSILWPPAAATVLQMRVSFCNKTASAVDMAVGYDLTGADETRSEGWFTVQPCACTTLFNEGVKTTDYWLYVTRIVAVSWMP